uniref:Dolichyl-diphosphooligosaccharide--protein glycosyltransferase subunit 2 n=1 Tax=Leersia perrieri TaxID=77586 RepID=A0A0D9V9C5_9ORYZ
MAAGRLPASVTLLLLLLAATAVAPLASAVRPVSDAHRSAAAELFAASPDGSFGDVERIYEAVRTFQILGVEKDKSLTGEACKVAAEKLASSSSTAKDLFHAVRISGVLGCGVDSGVYDDVATKLKAVIKDTNSLLELYYSLGGLLSIKEKGHNVVLPDADSTFHAIKALSQSDGRWRYDTNSAESSTFAAGVALEALASVVSLADSEIDPSMIAVVKNDIVKLFDTIKSYGMVYSDDIRAFVPLILSLPSKVFSLTSKDQLKVEVTTVFGSAAPPLRVNLVQVLGSDSKVITTEAKELQFDLDSNVHYLDIAPLKIDVGKYSLVFEISLQEPEHETIYAIGGRNTETIFVTGLIKVDKAEIGISDNDAGSVESVQKIDPQKDASVSLSANHLQKLRLSFQLSTPLGKTFKPHQRPSTGSFPGLIEQIFFQVFLKLKHESKVEHLFVVPGSARQFKIDFLGLVEKFYYLSGRYDLELAVGDAAMENSFLRALGHLELDLPEAPEKAPKPPAQAVDPFSKFGPKKEISHIFRAPEKRPPKELSFAFTGLTLLPFVGFLIGLMRLGVNLKNFPPLSAPAVFASLFHEGIGAVLLLYVLFWVKLDLFTTLKYLSFLGVFLVFVGHRALSYLSSMSAKQKTA